MKESKKSFEQNIKIISCLNNTLSNVSLHIKDEKISETLQQKISEMITKKLDEI